MSGGITFSAELKGAREASGRFARLADELPARIEAGVGDIGNKARDLYRSAAPHGETGRFRESFSATVARGESGFQLEIKTYKPDLLRWLRYGTGVYAEPDETGHVAHGHGPSGEIVPIKASALHWTEGGSDVFARSVKGIHPNKWQMQVDLAARELVRIEGQRLVARVIAK